MHKYRYTLLLLFICSLFSYMPKAAAQYDYPVSLQTFYDELAPYGQWVNESQYGYVFVPDVDQNFRPYYTEGHWAMTDYGNTWVSDYQWGWACFHYGRWTYDGYYGWVWIPGTEWGPAWVNWRGNNDYYGWAPLGPDYTMGSSFGSYYCPDDWWIFIPPAYLYDRNYYKYWNGPRDNGAYISQTTIINNTYENNGNHTTYNPGPRATAIEGITHYPVTVYHLNDKLNPGKSRMHGDNIKMYHPLEVPQTAGNSTRPAAPANAIQAPRQIGKAQPVATGNAPAFHNEIINSRQFSNTPAQATEPQRYEWNVNRAQPQQQPRTFEAPQNNNNNNTQRQQPVQQQPQRAPGPAFNNRPVQQQAPRPVMQSAPRSAPVAAPRPSGGGSFRR